MHPERQLIEQRIRNALESTPTRIPVLIGSCGSGRSTLLHRTYTNLTENSAHYIDAEHVALTPEGLLNAVTDDSGYFETNSPVYQPNNRHSSRAAFDALLEFFNNKTLSNSKRQTFLIDELLDIRTLESFPVLRGVMRELFY